jgi:hypothetical protein
MLPFPAGAVAGVLLTVGWLLILAELHPGRPLQSTIQLPNSIVGSLLALKLAQLDILLGIVWSHIRTTGRSALTRAFIASIAPNSLPPPASPRAQPDS